VVLAWVAVCGLVCFVGAVLVWAPTAVTANIIAQGRKKRPVTIEFLSSASLITSLPAL
jgi:hypothetical protein